MADSFPIYTDDTILKLRPERNDVDPRKPYAFLIEPEINTTGDVVDVATLFLTNNECPFRCLMCDLWKNTLERNAPPASIPRQIEYALTRLPASQSIKLYNSGNFFDPKAIPPSQYGAIAELVRHFETVVVENHPNLCGDRCLEFRDAIAPAQLEVALGLETCHSELLKSLNKGMTLDDFARATKFLATEKIRIRTFILLKPPFLNEEQGVEWAIKSIEYAFEHGVECCSLVPTRTGNGIMDQLEREGDFAPPTGASIEQVLAAGMQMKGGRVLMDLWDAEKFFPCQHCQLERISRLNKMNLMQAILPAVICDHCS